MKKALILISAAAIVVAAVSCNGHRGQKVDDVTDSLAVDTTSLAASQAQASELSADPFDNLPEEPVLDIKTNMGTIRVKLYSGTPKHRDNFIKLSKAHFYDSLLFHRVIPGFMIQCGDPNSKGAPAGAHLGSGGPGYTIPAEFRKQYCHKKGALAAARMGDSANPYRESSGSQFYIVQDEMNCIHLDDNYTVFGETLDGMDVIDRIAKVATDPYDRPLNDVVILSILPVDEKPAE